MRFNAENNLWKGLDYYNEGETIYGRDQDIESLSLFIFGNTQCVLYGKSGIGKSSILRAGIFPRARKRGIIPIYIHLTHDFKYSGTNYQEIFAVHYLQQIKSAIMNGGLCPVEQRAVIDPTKESLWEFFHCHQFEDKNNDVKVPLLLFDQFEEIFTLQKDTRIREELFSQLGDLLNDVCPTYVSEAIVAARRARKSRRGREETDGRDKIDSIIQEPKEEPRKYIEYPEYHMVFSMREDYLSYLERYTTYIPVMKNNRYGLSPVNREQAKEIITKPREGLVSDAVADVIISNVENKETKEVDVALLSLYLHKLFLKIPAKTGIITERLADKYKDDFLLEFYEDNLKVLPVVTFNWPFLYQFFKEKQLEAALLTTDGKRNLITINSLEKIIKRKYINRLIDNKLLRRDVLNGKELVELVHDKLCAAIIGRRDGKNGFRGAVRYMLIRLAGGGFIFLLLLLGVAYFLFNHYFLLTGTIALQEDRAIGINEYWKAQVSITIPNDDSKNSRDTLWISEFNKGNNVQKFAVPYLKALQNDVICNIDYQIGGMTSVCDSMHLFESRHYSYRVQKAKVDTLLCGSVSLMSGSKKSVSDAIIIYQNRVTQTDEEGKFCFYEDGTESAYGKDNMLQIVKSGFRIRPIQNPKNGSHYLVSPVQAGSFLQECMEIESKINDCESKIDTWGHILMNDKNKGMQMVLAKEGAKIFGYYLYDEDIENSNISKQNYYFILSGVFVDDNAFIATSYDDAFNRSIIEAKIEYEEVISGTIVTGNKKSKFRYTIDHTNNSTISLLELKD